MVMFSLSLDSRHFQTLYHHSKLSKLLISKNQLLALHFVFINITLLQCYNSTNYNIIYTVLSGVPHIYLTCSGAFLIKFIIVATSRDCVFNTWSGAFLMNFYYYLGLWLILYWVIIIRKGRESYLIKSVRGEIGSAGSPVLTIVWK